MLDLLTLNRHFIRELVSSVLCDIKSNMSDFVAENGTNLLERFVLGFRAVKEQLHARDDQTTQVNEDGPGCVQQPC